MDLKSRHTFKNPRRFRLIRHEDETGISGTGIVAFGIQFPDGNVVTRWNSDVAQTCVWASIEEVEAVHGHGGLTEIRWTDRDGEPDALQDDEHIDPEGTALRALVERLRLEPHGFGAVCQMFELCSHPLCQASITAYFELERAEVALGLRD